MKIQFKWSFFAIISFISVFKSHSLLELGCFFISFALSIFMQEIMYSLLFVLRKKEIVMSFVSYGIKIMTAKPIFLWEILLATLLSWLTPCLIVIAGLFFQKITIFLDMKILINILVFSNLLIFIFSICPIAFFSGGRLLQFVFHHYLISKGEKIALGIGFFFHIVLVVAFSMIREYALSLAMILILLDMLLDLKRQHYFLKIINN